MLIHAFGLFGLDLNSADMLFGLCKESVQKNPKTFSPFQINVLTFKWTSALYYLHLFTRHFSYKEFFIFLTMFKLFCSPLICIKIFKGV